MPWSKERQRARSAANHAGASQWNEEVFAVVIIANCSPRSHPRPHPRIRDLCQIVGTTPTVYLMARVLDMDDVLYDEALGWLARQLPTATLLSARDEWTSTADWLARWPEWHPRVGAGVVVTVPATDHAVGRGVVRELRDLAARRVPLLWLTQGSHGRAVRAVAHFHLAPVAFPDFSRYATLVTGNRGGAAFHPCLDAIPGESEAWR